MIQSVLVRFFIVLVFVWPASAQLQLQHGDVLVSTSDEQEVIGGPPQPVTAYILVFGRSGVFKGELIRFPDIQPGDLLYRDGILYAIRSPNIERIDSAGRLLTPLTTDAAAANWLSPGPAGGLIAVGSDLYQYAADGTRVRRREFDPIAGGGIDLGPDGCTLFSNRSSVLSKWDACLDSGVTSFGEDHGTDNRALRVLPDGSFLVQGNSGGPVRTRHVDSNGSTLRSYAVSGGTALDVDGRSFWTSTGCGVIRIDIATGVVLTVSDPFPGCVRGLFVWTVVGEPRAGLPSSHASEPTIPTLSPFLLALLSIALATAAWRRFG
jgi:hypothetical protein